MALRRAADSATNHQLQGDEVNKTFNWILHRGRGRRRWKILYGSGFDPKATVYEGDEILGSGETLDAAWDEALYARLGNEHLKELGVKAMWEHFEKMMTS